MQQSSQLPCFFKSKNHASKLQEGLVRHLYRAFPKTPAFQWFSCCMVLTHALLAEDAWICVMELLEQENSKCESCEESLASSAGAWWRIIRLNKLELEAGWVIGADRLHGERIEKAKMAALEATLSPVIILSASRMHQKLLQFLRIAW